MSARPKIVIEKDQTDKTLDALALSTLVFMWVFALVNYTTLPETIPVHFDANGTADGYGSRLTLFLLPAIGSAQWFLLGWVAGIPESYNYNFRITPENAAPHYRLSVRFIRLLRFVILLIFALIVVMMINAATGKKDGLGAWFLPLVLGLVFGPIIWYFVQAKKINRRYSS